MLVLSVPVLTRNLSKLQFLLAVAARPLFWPDPAILKTKKKKSHVWVGPFLQTTPEISKFSPDPSWRLGGKKKASECFCWHTFPFPVPSFQPSNLPWAFLLRNYLRRCFCRWYKFLLLVCSGRPAFSSSPLLLSRRSPNTGWRWWRRRGSRPYWSYTCY